MDFYERLVDATDVQRRRLLTIPFLRHGVGGELTLDSYVAFLTQAYHHVKHTVPLLMACGARMPERLEWLRAAVGEYIGEEMGHQEWILGDIAACGFDVEAVRAGQPGSAAELMVAYAYDTIQRRNPVGFFGMVYVLEGTSVQLASAAADAMQARLNLPASAFSYLRSHGALDVDHVSFFRDLMNRLDERHDQEAVIHCARMFFELYGNIFRSLPLNLLREVPHAAAQ